MIDRRLTPAEKTAIVITLVLAAFVGGFYLGQGRSVSAGPQVSVEYAQAYEPVHTQSTGQTQQKTENAQGLININTASGAELQQLPGIGEVLARRIIGYREENGPFENKEEITLVEGIGDGILEDILDMITVGGEEK